MSKLLACFAALCFTVHHSLFLMEEQISSFTKIETIKSDISKNSYPAIWYENNKGESALIHQTFPQTIVTNHFARTGDSDRNHLSLLLNALLSDTIKRENYLINYFTDPVQIGQRKHTITCHNVLKDEHNKTIVDNYFCFSLESNIFVTFSSPIKEDYTSYIILRHLNQELKEKIICIPGNFSIHSIFLEKYFLIVGSHILESYRSSEKVKNKYHIDIFNAAKFANNELIQSDNLNGDLDYYLSIDIEDTDSNSNLESATQNPSLALITVENKLLFLQNQRTQKYIPLNFDTRTEKTEEVDTISIRYTLTKGKYLKILPRLDKNVLSPFKQTASFLDRKDAIIRIIRYENEQGYYVEAQQTFPVILTTNFVIKTKEKSMPNPFDEGRLTTCIKKDKKALHLLMNTFLGKIEKNELDLSLYYVIENNIDKHTQTVIKCYQDSRGCHNVPSFKTYRCFSLESRLLAIYSTYFSPQISADVRHKVVLRHLNDTKKERTLTIDKKFKIAAVFLEGYFLIVGSYLVESYNKMVKNKYRIDIYNAEQFATNVNTPDLDEKNSDVTYCYSFDIEYENSLSVDEAENNDPLLKLITITDECCILQNQTTETYIRVFYKDPKKAVKTPELKVICTNNAHEQPATIDQPPKTDPTTPPDKKNGQNWLRNGNVQKSVVTGTILLILLIAAYNYQKMPVIF